MKRLVLAFILIAGLTGCAAIKEQVQIQKDNWEACKNDPVCFDKAKGMRDKVEIVATPLAAALPIPGAAVAPKILSQLSFAFFMLFGGHALLKRGKKEVPA